MAGKGIPKKEFQSRRGWNRIRGSAVGPALDVSADFAGVTGSLTGYSGSTRKMDAWDPSLVKCETLGSMAVLVAIFAYG